MEIIVGKTSGFCFGVKNAVEQATKKLEEKQTEESLYCLGELVHNRQVVEKLAKKGLITVEKVEKVPKGKTCIIRAHGITKQEYEKAEQIGITLIDLTCPKVVMIHKKIESYRKNGYILFLYGKKEHPETIGNASYGGENCFVIETEEELKKAIQVVEQRKERKIAILSQTTFGLQEFERYTEQVKERLKEKEIQVENTICNSTNLRQKETEELAKQVDCMIIIGGRHSSNTMQLYEIAKKSGKKAIHIEKAEECDKEEIKAYAKIGIMAGASTPQEEIEKLICNLQ